MNGLKMQDDFTDACKMIFSNIFHLKNTFHFVSFEQNQRKINVAKNYR